MPQRRNIPESDFVTAAMFMWQGFMQRGPIEAADNAPDPTMLASHVWLQTKWLMNEYRSFMSAHHDKLTYDTMQSFQRTMLPTLGAWYREHRRLRGSTTSARSHFSRMIYAHFIPPAVEAVGVPVQPGTLSPAAAWPYPTLSATHI